MDEYMIQYERWLNSDCLSDAERAELAAIADDPTEIRFRFSSYLSFGTAGLRGTMKTGMNAMNVHTVAYATQALANVICAEGRAADGVAIAYDSRYNSKLFAETAASVLAAADIPVYLFDELRPTPELSFALRELKCVAGINITASHNPKAYNGYKAYWEDGAQLPPEHADRVAAVMNELDIFKDVRKMDYAEALAAGKITLLGAEMDEKYLANVQAQAVNPQAVRDVADEMKIVYSPLHGAGYRLVPEVLSRIGMKHLLTVPEQMVIDGGFPTVEKPNPEYKNVFELGIAIANREGSDLVLATDPDADRVGVATRTADGDFITITGNQMGALLMDYILTAYEETGTMPEFPYAIKTIVTTELATRICEAHGVKIHNVLTGFKFIGEVIKSYEAAGYGTFMLGFEESYGYLKGTYARDKDAVVASMLICEMTAYYKARNMTLFDALNSLYEKYGFCFESTVEIYQEGVDGPALIAARMEALRSPIPTEIAGRRVAKFADYLTSEITDLASGKVEPTGLPQSNVLSFTLDNGDVIVARPSGTEPKIKFYFLLMGENKAETEAKFNQYRTALNV